MLCKDLASQGYIVFSLQHYEPVLLEYEREKQIPAERKEELKLMKAARQIHLDDRVKQTVSLINYIKNE